MRFVLGLAILCICLLGGISFWQSSSSMSGVEELTKHTHTHSQTASVTTTMTTPTQSPWTPTEPLHKPPALDKCRDAVSTQVKHFRSTPLLDYFGQANRDDTLQLQYFRNTIKLSQVLSHGEFTVRAIKKPIRLVGVRRTLEWTLFEQLCRKDYGELADLHFQQGDMVVDLGANIGLYSVLLALMHPQIKIIAYEASPLNALIATENVRLNGLDHRVAIKNQAITGDGRDVAMSICMDHDRLNRIGGTCRGGRMINMTVPSTTFERALEDGSLTQIALLKLDCEGCECDVLPHIHAVHIRHAVGECHHWISTQCMNDCKRTLEASTNLAVGQG